VGGGVADHFRLALAGDDESDVNWQEVDWELVIDREEQRVGEVAVFWPFQVGQEVARAGFHFDAGKSTVAAQGQDVGAAAVRQRHLVHRRPAELEA